MNAYKPLYQRNERFYELTKPKLLELVCAETGLDHDNITAKRITNTFLEVKKLADFEKVEGSVAAEYLGESAAEEEDVRSEADQPNAVVREVGKLGLAYNINLILPNTDDPKVFNAIFRSLKDNLL